MNPSLPYVRAEPSPVDGGGAPLRPDPRPTSLIALVNVVLRRRGLVVLAGLLTMAAVIAVGLVRPRTYSARGLFVAQSRGPSQGGNISGLAAQLGLSMGGDGSQSPQFYVELLRSRNMLRDAVSTTYTFRTDTGVVSGTLVELFGVKGESPGVRTEVAMERLDERVTTAVTPKTGTVTLGVRTYHAPLSQQIAARMLALLGKFNLETRQSQAAAERRFAEQRLGEIANELRDAENRFAAFLVRNREYRAAPGLRLEEERLSREVEMRRRVYYTLADSYERAKIDEVRDTPVFTIIEAPEVPARADRRGLIPKGLLGLLAGIVFGILLVVIGHLLHPTERSPGEVHEFAVLRRQALDDLTHPWRPVARLFGGRRRAAAR